MKITGIITEYNPFHNGHVYHIQKARELTEPDVLVAVMSGNFNQRGDVSVMDKFLKTEVALKHGVDLIIELPFIDTIQNAYVFGKKAVHLLDLMHVDHLVFGSETNNLEELKKYSELEVDVTRLKMLLHDGNSFPKSYGLLSGSLYPNDMLAVTYLKAMKDTSMEPVCIQRTNDYHSTDLEIISSATAIRKALQEGKDVSQATPVKISDPIFNSDLYPYLRKLLFTTAKEDLQKIFMVSEGIENMLMKNAVECEDYEDFINSCISRRYTRSRIQRTLLHIACQIKKEDIESLPEKDYIRVLGFNEKGRQLLKELKDEVNIITQFKNLPDKHKKIEWKTSLIYASLTKDLQAYLKKELQGPIIV
ncbi:MAG: nucleotidyltransferase [Erysipelotrichaceae bacterium]|nr:nucleotidyltransferase [Erysipelotrichaceae bacterium]